MLVEIRLSIRKWNNFPFLQVLFITFRVIHMEAIFEIEVTFFIFRIQAIFLADIGMEVKHCLNIFHIFNFFKSKIVTYAVNIYYYLFYFFYFN